MRSRNMFIIISCFIIGIGISFFIGRQSLKKDATPTEPTSASTTVQTTTEQTTSKTMRTSHTLEQTDSSETLSQTETERHLPVALQGYSDEEIEYARVWLTVMGEGYLETVGKENFNLHVSFIQKGEPLYLDRSELNVNWPTDIIVLTGNISAQGQIFYSSNFDGTVDVYPMPSHWHLEPEDMADDDYMTTFLTNILNQKSRIVIPAGNPTLLKELIDLEIINN